MSEFIGIDTSNYTSSCAIYNSDDDSFISYKKLLPVTSGQLGLRQSDTVFHHNKNLPHLLEDLLDRSSKKIAAVSASYAPRDCDGSYMPCFSVGEGYASVLSSAFSAKKYLFSHQAGHIAAAVHSSGHKELIEKEFIAFHVSGGTTDVLLVTPDDDDIFKIKLVASSLDLKAGQAVDRAGVMLGLDFPAGKFIDSLACQSDKQFKTKPFFKDGSCSFSGLENKCKTMNDQGIPHCDIAKYCIDYITQALRLMIIDALNKYGNLPLLFAGGVMSNSIISKVISDEFGAYFAKPEFSSDNAAGTAYLGYIREHR